MGKHKSGGKSATAKSRDKKARKARKVAGLTPKKKCCKSSPRCLRCPVVVHRMQKAATHDPSDKKLVKALKKARAA
ncbi:hypothetical protein G4X40_21580 [Rhodococcus sp. D2-41]|uniref:Uncharacterized protein n=1 Tax=Speluncibacter jeojiensis TaxID=2710754 RepID=A0A9X4REM7_9ACTN|nr:hypothetical protein [Rhodococcus sp. D2-41]MDG3012734.1 hypothetical protein [Rhodococcus sp. D2-41]MDG3015412.1 hypothetical protein [Corynebacteriales bacterium D3-21]